MQNNRNLSFSSCMYKLYATWSYWYCGPSNTGAGGAARVICFTSTAFMMVSGIFYLPYYLASIYMNHGEVKYDTYLSFFTDFSTTLFFFGLSGYVMTPIIGHGFCDIVNAICRNQVIDVEQQEESYEPPSSAIAPPSYEEIFFGEDPPSYEEALAVIT